jgi:membrane-associated HD superfamily phosphohydrolase
VETTPEAWPKPGTKNKHYNPMRTKRILFRMMMLMVMVGFFSSCQRDVLISKREVRNLDLVKVATAERPVKQPAVKVTEVEEDQQIATSVPETSEEASIPSGLSDNVETVAAKTAIPVLQSVPVKVARQAIRNTTQKAMSQVVATASPLVKPKQTLSRSEKQELKKVGKKSNDVDLVRLILYLLAALLIITILNILFKGYFLSIVGLVLVILLILWLLGMF